MSIASRVSSLITGRAGDPPAERRGLEQFIGFNDWPGPFSSGYGWGQGVSSDAQVERAMGVVAVWACLRIISNAVSTLPLIPYAEREDGTRERVARTERVYRLLHDMPNPRLPAGEFFGLVACHLAGWGNAFLLKDRLVQGGPVTGLFPVLPSMTTVSLLDDGTPQYTLHLPDGDVRVTSTDVIHIRAFGTDGIMGLSPIAAARKAIQSMEMEESYRVNLLRNDARVSGILSTDQELSAEASERLLARWKAAHGGAGRAGGTAVLEGGMKWQQMALGTKDMQFIEQREYSVAEIARLFGVPPSMVNAKSGDALTYATTESQGIAFVRDCLMPYLKRIEQALSNDWEVVPDGYCVEFLVDGLLRADMKTRSEVYATLISSGVMTPNEARDAENLPRIPGLDMNNMCNHEPGQTCPGCAVVDSTDPEEV